MLIWKLCSLQTFARAFLKHLQRLPWNVTFLVQMAECAATAGGFSTKPTLQWRSRLSYVCLSAFNWHSESIILIFGGCETLLDLCWCQTNRANLPCKEIQIRQKAFNNVLHYGGKGLVYHCFAVFHSCLVARLPKTLQVATEMTERCFVEHKIVSVLKSDFLLGMLYDALFFALWLQSFEF